MVWNLTYLRRDARGICRAPNARHLNWSQGSAIQAPLLCGPDSFLGVALATGCQVDAPCMPKQALFHTIVSRIRHAPINSIQFDADLRSPSEARSTRRPHQGYILSQKRNCVKKERAIVARSVPLFWHPRHVEIARDAPRAGEHASVHPEGFLNFLPGLFRRNTDISQKLVIKLAQGNA